MNKLVLGTVQFGLQYGINSAGRPSAEQISEILDNAKGGGIQIIDTSSAYGNAEEVLGAVKAGANFKIVSKYPKCDKTVVDVFNNSLQAIGTDHLYGYLLHHFEVYRENKAVWNDFVRLQKDGKADRIGFSLYEPCELELIFNDGIPFSLIQVPYNIFDRRFEPYFKKLKEMDVEIHVRSTFLQGLFFKDLSSLSKQLVPLKPYLSQIKSYCTAHAMTIEECALSFVLNNPFIDGVLVGVDNVNQLCDNIKVAAHTSEVDELANKITVKEKFLLNPSNWV